MAQTKITTAERDKAIETLREIFPVGSTATTIVRHVSSSGMSRAIQVLAVQDGEIRDVDYLVRRVLGWPLHRSDAGVVVKGAGMDMAFHLVYSLSSALHGDGYAISKRSV